MKPNYIIALTAVVLFCDSNLRAQGPGANRDNVPSSLQSGMPPAPQGPETSNLNEDPVAVVPQPDLVPENLALISTGEFNPKHIFIADKEKRTLTVWSHEKERPKLIGAYPMDIGKLQGDKLAAGDFRTPEGIYFFQQRKDESELDFSLYGKRAFTLDYPNYFDQRVSKTGSGIWLHAVPDSVSLLRGSRGCVVVRNKIIEMLTPLIKLKSTPLLILDKVNYVTPDKVSENRRELQNWVESWRRAWESKDIDNYMSYYGEGFKAMRMNKEKWRAYKMGLNARYNNISIEVKEPFLLMKKNEAIISFIQKYHSDGLKDLGEKTLYVEKDQQGKYKILTEIWRPVAQDLLVYHARDNSSTTPQNQ